MKASILKKKYLDFFKDKNHQIIPSSSLIPANDPTTLFTGSGMQPMMPFLLGAPHPLGTRIADSQKCFRAQDIEEVGDNRHTTFFEMLGNWSFGDYFKNEQIPWMFSFLVDELELDPKNLYVSVFKGYGKLPKDEDSIKLWQEEFKKKGIVASVGENPLDGMGEHRIFLYGEKKNWWSRTGVPDNMPLGEPGGPDSEMFYDFGSSLKLHEHSPWSSEPCHINCDCGRFLEIGNNVFMTYLKTANGFENLPKMNVDFGGGLERLTAAAQNNSDVFLIDVFNNARVVIEKLSKKKYGSDSATTGAMRVLLDHLRASVFLIQDGAIPSNKDQGYFTRRLIRRAVRYGQVLGMTNFCSKVGKAFIDEYSMEYALDEKNILAELDKEEQAFQVTLSKGLQVFENIAKDKTVLTGEEAFLLYQSYGFPIEMTEELAKEKNITIDRLAFETELDKHKAISRVGAEQKFKGGLADHSEKTTRLHTATHLLNEALRKVVSSDIKQRGSNITSERLRFDFNFDRKLTPDEIKKVEDCVNEQIKKDFVVERMEMPLNDALAMNAQAEFGVKYPDMVSVYKVGGFSLELCGGPHVKHTGELGHFRIIKEESAAAGIRRIKAVVE